MDYEICIFSSPAAEQASGLKRATRDMWRKRGFLPPVVGRGTFDFLDIAHMKALKVLSDRGISPGTLGMNAKVLAVAMLRAALCRPEAWQDYSEALRKDVDRWLNQIGKQLPAQKFEADGSTWLGAMLHKGPYWVFMPDGGQVITDKLDDQLEKIPAGGGPFVVVNFHRMAADLVRSLGPIVRIVEAETIDAGEQADA